MFLKGHAKTTGTCSRNRIAKGFLIGKIQHHLHKHTPGQIVKSHRPGLLSGTIPDEAARGGCCNLAAKAKMERLWDQQTK